MNRFEKLPFEPTDCEVQAFHVENENLLPLPPSVYLTGFHRLCRWKLLQNAITIKYCHAFFFDIWADLIFFLTISFLGS